MRFQKSITLIVAALLASILGVGPLQAQISGSGVSSVPTIRKLAANAIPFIIAPTGTMANNGAITLGSALPTTYVNAYINLPASAIQAGSGAGWYFVQMSSTTLGTVFNNTYVSGIPTIPVPVGFVTTGPGAYTGVTGNVVGPQISIPAGALGPNGVLRLSQLNSVIPNTNSKVLSATIAGTTMWATTLNSAGQFGNASIATLMNRGVQNSNVVLSTSNPTGVGIAASGNQFTSFNFSSAQTVSLNLVLSVATDFIVLESYLVEVIPG